MTDAVLPIGETARFLRSNAAMDLTASGQIEIFDADQHYYEAEDCFTRYASQRMKTEKFIRWVTEADGKRKRLFAGGREANVIGNPTFDPITAPGI